MMRKTLLALAALGGFIAVGAGAQAAPPAVPAHLTRAYATSAHQSVTPVDYEWHHHRYHHRRWEHNRWHYYD
ncbi:MAG TPA: hypothetical protein VE690_07960 [Rhodopila sp.]|nr:hypothetical protein [Rhodopila sp.]